MLISGLGTAVPERRYSQSACWHALQAAPEFHALSPRSQAILRKVLGGKNGIATRYLSLENLREAFELNPDALHARFLRQAPVLAAQAARQALADAHVAETAIDALVISTCTGYLCPGLTSYVAQELGLRRDVLNLDLVGQGCVAALPNLCTGEALLGSGRCRHVLSVAVEVCSAAFYLDDDPGVLVSACLFGDGAGAAVLTNESNGRRTVEWKQTGSLLNPRARDLLRFEQKNGMLRNRLSAEVPQLAAEHAAQLCAEVLERAGLARSQVSAWLLHPGGRDVLLALRQKLDLEESQVRWSAEVLEEYGNLSSASLYFVLQKALQHKAPGGYWWMSSFGAGFSCQGALLRVAERVDG